MLNVVEGPTEETAPVSPRPTLNLALGGVLGLGAGIAIAVSRRLMDKTLRTVEDVEAAAGLPVLAGVPVPAPAGTAPASAARAPKGPKARRKQSASLLEEAGGGSGRT